MATANNTPLSLVKNKNAVTSTAPASTATKYPTPASVAKNAKPLTVQKRESWYKSLSVSSRLDASTAEKLAKLAK